MKSIVPLVRPTIASLVATAAIVIINTREPDAVPLVCALLILSATLMAVTDEWREMLGAMVGFVGCLGLLFGIALPVTFLLTDHPFAQKAFLVCWFVAGSLFLGRLDKGLKELRAKRTDAH